MKAQLTHDFNFDRSSGRISFGVFRNASVARLIRCSFDVLDDQCSVGEDFLLSVDGQHSILAFPDNWLNGVTSNWTRHNQSFTGHNWLLLHGSNVRQAVDVQLSSVLNDSNLRCSDALVQTTVFGLSRCDVEIRHNVTVDCNILADLEALWVGYFLSVKFPRDFRSWIATGDALDEDWIVRVENFFGESLSDDWWIDCGI